MRHGFKGAVGVAALAAVAAGACQLVDPPGPLTSESDGPPDATGGADATLDAAGDGDVPADAPADSPSTDAAPRDASTCDADLARDEANCGRCGRSCFGGRCADGGCGAALAFPGPFGGMAYDRGTVYFTRDAIDGGVSSYDTVTGAQRSLVDGVRSPKAITVRDPYLFWAADDQRIHRALVDGGAHTTLATTGETGIGCVAANLTDVFWPNGTKSEIERVGVDGGAVTSLPGSSTLHLRCVRADDASAIFTTDTSGFVQEALATSATIASPDPGDTLDIALVGQDAWFSASPDLYHVKLGGFAATKVATTRDGTQILSLAADANGIYWTAGGGAGLIQGCADPTCASGVVTLTRTGPGFPSYAVLSPEAIFFYSSASNSVYRLAR